MKRASLMTSCVRRRSRFVVRVALLVYTNPLSPQVFLAETVSTFSSRHPDYSILAGRIYVAYIHKRVQKRFSEWVFSQDRCTILFVFE